MGSSSNNDGDVNETGKKESVYICKTATLLHVHYTFFYFSAVVASVLLETS